MTLWILEICLKLFDWFKKGTLPMISCLICLNSMTYFTRIVIGLIIGSVFKLKKFGNIILNDKHNYRGWIWNWISLTEFQVGVGLDSKNDHKINLKSPPKHRLAEIINSILAKRLKHPQLARMKASYVNMQTPTRVRSTL